MSIHGPFQDLNIDTLPCGRKVLERLNYGELFREVLRDRLREVFRGSARGISEEFWGDFIRNHFGDLFWDRLKKVQEHVWLFTLVKAVLRDMLDRHVRIYVTRLLERRWREYVGDVSKHLLKYPTRSLWIRCLRHHLLRDGLWCLRVGPKLCFMNNGQAVLGT